MTGMPVPRDVKDSANVVAKLPGCIGRIAVVGHCLGGLMTFITAARYGVDAAVVYHGGDTEKYLGEVNGLDAPLPMHLAEEDEFISKGHRRWETWGPEACAASPISRILPLYQGGGMMTSSIGP
jgi:dienelactone hydrolase